MSAALRSLTVDTPGTATRAWEYGDPAGEPLILVHGFRGDHHGLNGLARGIVDREPQIRAIVPDLPGFGESPRLERNHNLAGFSAWLRGFAERVAPSGHAILGHSFGSLVVARAIADGLGPASVVLVNPISAPALEGPRAVLTRLAIAYYRAAEMLPDSAARRLLGAPLIVRIMSEAMAKTRDRDLRSWIHDQHARFFSRFADSSMLLEAFRASVAHTVAEFAESIDQPTLIVAGDRDDITPLTEQLALQRSIAGSQLRIIPGVGHLVHYEAHEDAAGNIVDFLRNQARSRRQSGGSKGSGRG